MGHSSKAGENIFWAMNRNKPGIIKRILNALERFIARIRGKDAYLAVEQRQAAERLRDMLTGELKRAYGTDVKGEAAVESGEGKRHSLAGANSRTADLNSLGGAYQMYQNGVSMDTIRKRTGWWLGKDGKWRYEISDKEMRFNPEGYVDNPQTVGDYVKHDRLFAAYPWIADIPVHMVDVVTGGSPATNGKYSPDGKFIELKKGLTSEKAKYVLSHELQHAIQQAEGFVRGTSPKTGMFYAVNLAYDLVKNNPEFVAESKPQDKMNYLIGYLEAKGGASLGDYAKYYYFQNYGETEARNVSQRLDMTEEERRDLPIENNGEVFSYDEVFEKIVDNLKAIGYNKKQIDTILKEGVSYDIEQTDVQTSADEVVKRRRNDREETGRLSDADENGRRPGEIYRTGKIPTAGVSESAEILDSERRNGGLRRGNRGTDSQNGALGAGSEAGKRLNEVSKPEKRFSLSSNVEQTKDLIAVHNMTAAELEKSLDLGGLPMPSIAIIKAADGHSEYGDVSLVFGKDTIDPKKSARNKVYGGDAWTPTFPKIDYKANENVGKQIRDKYYDLSRKYGYDNTRALYNYAQDLSDVLTSEGGEKAMIDKLYGDTGMMQIYLMDTGRERIANVNKETKTALTDGQVRQYENLIDTLGRDEMNGFARKDGEELSDLVRRRKAFIEENEAGIRKAFEKTFVQDGMSAKDAAEVSAELALSDLRKYVLDTFNYIKNGAETVKTEFDSEATDAAIKKAADGEGYRKWVNDLFGGAEEKSGIRNSKDAYTASGNRRSFEALHWENNLENIVNAMLEQDETGGAFFSGTGIWGVSAKKYNSISEIKNDSSRLRTMNEAEYNALKEQYGARMQEIAQTLIDPKNDNYFIASDDAYSLIVDAVRNSKDESGILRYLKKYNSRATEKTASDIAALVRDIAEMPTGYFEAKPQRAVGFDEVKAVILPDNASGELVSRLESDGINTVTYKAGDENSRLEALNGVRDVRFSLSSADTDIYSRIFDMQREETELTNRIREIEKSDAFKKANDDLSKAINNDNIAEGMKAYQAWSKESGYADLVDRRDALRADLKEIRTKANNDAVSKAINEERTAIEKSGLSEADYFRKQAVKEFGYTPYFYDAGYIMPNGKMLNFSGEKGRHYGSRGQDHRAIGTIYADTNGTDALVRFMNDGNIRIMAGTPGLDISASTEPSKEQYTTIRRFANEFSDGGYFAVDLSDENGKTVGTLEYEGNINPTRIVNDIKHFYETGEVREQSGLDRFRYSLTRANDEYMKAVESGNVEEQQRLVDEAAKANGYDRLFWHGSKKGGGFTEFRDWSYFTENKKYASRYAKAGDKGSLYEVYANLGNAFDTRKPECREIFDKMRSEYGLSKVQESGLPDWTDGYDIAEFIDENGLDYDSIILDEGGDLVDGKPVSRGFSYVIRSSEQVKSAAPITYDDSGNVIPLTERFDSGNRDIRWSLVGTNEDRAEAAEFSDSGIRYSLRKEDPPKKTLTGYKVFVVKNGKLYPPMVANPDAADTPVGVWLNADIGAQAPDSKTGRKQVKAGGKGTQGGSGSLAFRPGWHLGETPLATQFDRTNPETGKRELFPENFVWAECEIAADKNYQEEAMSYGYTKSGKFQHSLAGLPKLPVDGYYKYRTNPNPDTVPWLITGAMKVNRLLDDAEVNRILESKGLPPKNRVGGNKTLADLGLEETAKRLNGDGNIRYSLSANAAEEIKKALADKNYSSEIKLTDTTPTIMLGHNEVKNLPLMMRATHLRENILTREQAKAKGLPTNPGINYHGLGEPLFLDVIADLDNVKEAYRGTQKSPNSDRRENYFLLISEKIDASGNTINIPVFINETAKYNNVFMDVNKAATVFGREQLRKYINRKLADGSLVRIKRRSIQSSEVSSPIEPHYRKNASSIDNSVSQNDPVVNTQSMQDVEKDSSDERHSLVKSAQSELKALQKENEKLRQDVDDLKQELQLTHGRKLSRDALISSIQKILIDGYGVKLSAKELYPHVTNLYDMFYNNTVDGKRLKKDERVDTMRIIEEMDKIVDAVIENAVGVDDTYVEMKKLLPELRNTKLVVPVDARADAAQSAGFENWAEFRKANFGRVGFANEGLPVDTYYMELSERYPELFPDGITHPGEQAAHIADVVNTIRESGINEYQLYDIEDERIRTSIKNDVMDIIGNAEKLQTFADRAAQKVEDTKLAEAMHYGADIAKLKRLNAEKVADIKAENRKRLSDMRRKYQDRVESVRERYAEARANRSEKQKQTVLRNKVLRKYTEASTMLDRPTTENHFTEAMRKPIMEFLAAVDITTGKSVAKQGIYDRILRVIEAANKVTAEGDENGLNIAETDLNVQEKQLIVDSGLLERMAAWVEANQGKKLTELSSAQLFDQIVSNEPPVGYVHLDLLQQPYFAADTVRISYEQHTEKNLRLDSRASVILAVIRLADSAGTSFSNTILSQA